MYLGGLGIKGDRRGSTVRQERREEAQQQREQRFESLATAAYPGVTTQEAVELYKQQRTAGQETQAFIRDYWPILAAAGIGFLVLSFLPGGRRRRR